MKPAASEASGKVARQMMGEYPQAHGVQATLGYDGGLLFIRGALVQLA